MPQRIISRLNMLPPEVEFETKLLDSGARCSLECTCPFVFVQRGIQKGDLSMNLRTLLSGRLAAAAMLTVLSASAVLAQGNHFNVRGSFDGHGIGVVQGGILQATATGSGAASHIGRFNYAL